VAYFIRASRIQDAASKQGVKAFSKIFENYGRRKSCYHFASSDERGTDGEKNEQAIEPD